MDFLKLDGIFLNILYEIQAVMSRLNIFHIHQLQIYRLGLREAITSSQYALLSLKWQPRCTTSDDQFHEILWFVLLI